MKKLVLILFCVLISIATQASERPVVGNWEKSFLIGERDSVYTHTEYGWSISSSGGLTFLFPNFNTSIKEHENKSSFRYGLDIQFGYEFKKGGEVLFGLFYNWFNTTSFYNFPFNSTRAENYAFLGIPIFYSFTFPINYKVGLNVYAGTLFNCLLSNKEYTWDGEFEGSWHPKNDTFSTKYRNLTMSTFGVVGAKVKLHSGIRTSVFLGAEYSIQMTPFTLVDGYKGNAWYFDYSRFIIGWQYKI